MIEGLFDYQIEHLIMFSPDIYFHLLAEFNASHSPWQWLMAIMQLALLLMLYIRPQGRLLRSVLPVLFAGQCWHIGYSFHFVRFQNINWPAKYFAYYFVLLGLTSLVLPFLPSRRSDPNRTRLSAIFCISVSLTFSTAQLVMGKPWGIILPVGLDSTATVLALLCLSRAYLSGWRFVIANIFASIWLLVASGMAYGLGTADFWLIGFFGCSLAGLFVTFRA